MPTSRPCYICSKPATRKIYFGSGTRQACDEHARMAVRFGYRITEGNHKVGLRND